jgi:hypothetical protein
MNDEPPRHPLFNRVMDIVFLCVWLLIDATIILEKRLSVGWRLLFLVPALIGTLNYAISIGGPARATLWERIRRRSPDDWSR